MAKFFNFPLQKVLDVRKHTEDRKAVELGLAQETLMKKKDKLDLLRKNKESVLKDVKLKISLGQLKIKSDYIEQINNMIQNQKAQVKKSTKNVAKKRDYLLEAVKDKKAVEILKDRHIENVRKTRKLAESKIENETAIRMVMRTKEDGR